MAVPESTQVRLGGKPKPDKAPATGNPPEAVEATLEEQYKAAYKSLKKAVTTLGTAVDNAALQRSLQKG